MDIALHELSMLRVTNQQCHSLNRIRDKADIRRVQRLASLSGLTYRMHRVKPEKMLEKYKAKVIDTSQRTHVKDCPSEWFICDDSTGSTRYFIIQGSYTLDHWKHNLSFAPSQLLDPSFHTVAHHGCLKSATSLSKIFLPHMADHIRKTKNQKDARIVLSGHSVGGSIATIILLMARYLDIITPDLCQQANVVTFGSPGIVSNTRANTDTHLLHHNDLLNMLELPTTSIQNIMMHHDIVPKIFSCNYSSFNNILRKLPQFKDIVHRLTHEQHPHMYSILGRVLVIQPDPEHDFLLKNPAHAKHPVLPDKPGLYELSECNTELQQFMNMPNPLEISNLKNMHFVNRYHNIDAYMRSLARIHHILTTDEECAKN